MALLLNIIVLMFEILYYSLFMKFARKEGKLIRYITGFSLMSIIGVFVGTTNLPSYLLLIVLILLVLKYIVKLKVSLYDMLIVIIMLFANLLIQFPVFVIFYNLLKCSHFVATLIFEIIKLLLVISLKDKLGVMYSKLQKLWKNNNFYIRYIFSCSVYVYVIFIIILLVKMIWEV